MLPALTTQHTPGSKGSMVNAYQGRWRWWYSSIVDLMIANPELNQNEIAAKLGKHPNTIGAIIGTDNFKTYFAHRRAEWMERHDFAIMSKTQEVGLQALDLVLETMKNKRTAVPLALLSNIADKSFERLGYGPKSPAAVQINNVNNGQQVVQLPSVSAEALMEAREALRRVERGHMPRMIEHQITAESGPRTQGSPTNGNVVEGVDSFVSEANEEMELAPISVSA